MCSKAKKANRARLLGGRLKAWLACLMALVLVSGMLPAQAMRLRAHAAVQPSLSAMDLAPADPPEGDELTLESARLVYKDADTGKFEPFALTDAEGAVSGVLAVGETASFDVELTYSDGSVKRASVQGVDVTWSVENTVQDGVEVVSVKDGRLSLNGARSKLVQLNAVVKGAHVDGCPAYVSLFKPTAAPSEGVVISSLSVDWGSSQSFDPASFGAKAIPSVKYGGASLRLGAVLATIDAEGDERTVRGGDAAAGLIWRATGFFNTDGKRSEGLFASVTANGQSAVVGASGSGEGWAVLRCTSREYPDFGGQEILVQVAGIDSGADKRIIESARLVYLGADGDWLDCGEDVLAIDRPFGTVAFDALLDFKDGSSARASELGIGVDWKLGGALSAGRQVVRMSADGVLAATYVKSSVVRVAGASVNGIPVEGTPVYIRITNNEPGHEPLLDEMVVTARSNYWVGASQRPDDASEKWYWRSSLNGGDSKHTRPLVVATASGTTSCELTGSVKWSDSSVTDSEELDGGSRIWSIESSTDFDGVECDALATVTREGVLTPSRSGSGYVTVACTSEIPYYDENGDAAICSMSGTLVVAVYQADRYLDSITLLGSDGKPIVTSSSVLPSGESMYLFTVRLKYIEFDEEEHGLVETEVTAPENGVEGLSIEVYRTEERTEVEGYSSVKEVTVPKRAGEAGPDKKSYALVAESGFARGYVYANVEKASFTGADKGMGITVIAEDSYESLGTVDSATIRVYHYSDYKNHGAGEHPAKTVTVTRSQLEAVANYQTWFTFKKRNNGFATAYAKGVTMRGLLSLCGVDPDRLQLMKFTGAGNYFAVTHSADYILGNQWRYTNFYYHKDLPSMMKAQSVAPMLALSYYIKNNAGYEDATDKDNAGDAGYGFMEQDSTLRVIFGMDSAEDNNAYKSVYMVSDIVVVIDDDDAVEDQEPEDPEDPEGLDDPGKIVKPVKPNEPSRSEAPENPGGSNEPSASREPGDDGEQGEQDPEKERQQKEPEEEEARDREQDDDAEKEQEQEHEHEQPQQGDQVRLPDDDASRLPVDSEDQGRWNVKQQAASKNPRDSDEDKSGDNYRGGGAREVGDGKGRVSGSGRRQGAATFDLGGADQAGVEDADGELDDGEGAALGEANDDLNDGSTDRLGESVLREMVESARMVVPPSEIDPIHWAALGGSVFLSFGLGAMAARRRFALDDADGAGIGASQA